MDKKINETDFLIFDVETTGLNPKAGDRIIEIAAIRYRDGKKYDSFSSLINPQREISPAAYAVNHITQDMVDSAPLSLEVLPKFLDFIGKSCLCGYNVGFDIGFLENELKLEGRTLDNNTAIVDIIPMARRFLNNLNSYSLSNVSKYLGINAPQEHRALSDCEMTVEVFAQLLSRISSKGIEDFLQFYNLFGVNLKLTEDINNQRIAAIQRAIDLGVRLKIRYCSTSAGEVTEREVSPTEVRQEGKYKYLVGYCHLRKDERTFKINGILDLEII